MRRQPPKFMLHASSFLSLTHGACARKWSLDLRNILAGREQTAKAGDQAGRPATCESRCDRVRSTCATPSMPICHGSWCGNLPRKSKGRAGQSICTLVSGSSYTWQTLVSGGACVADAAHQLLLQVVRRQRLIHSTYAETLGVHAGP